MSPKFIFSEKTQNLYIHFCSDSSLEYQLYPGKTIQAIGHYNSVELYQMAKAKAKIETKVKENVAEFQKTWLFDRFGTLTLKEIS